MWIFHCSVFYLHLLFQVFKRDPPVFHIFKDQFRGAIIIFTPVNIIDAIFPALVGRFLTMMQDAFCNGKCGKLPDFFQYRKEAVIKKNLIVLEEINVKISVVYVFP